ncbi:MAG: hypothetical protein E3J25_12645 [Anaerolineales bacterium]|nr:MAG: hypothetical protein E3J25_12645 [Anaerolineales bacterium]
MEPRARRLALILLVVSVLLAILAQYYLTRKRAFVWDGILIYVVAMLLFGLVVKRCEGRPGQEEGRQRPSVWAGMWQLLQASATRLVVLLVGVGLVAHVAVAAGSRPAHEPLWDLVALWGAGIVLAAGAFVNWSAIPARLGRTARALLRPNPEVALVALLVIGAFLLR